MDVKDLDELFEELNVQGMQHYGIQYSQRIVAGFKEGGERKALKNGRCKKKEKVEEKETR